MSKEAKTVKPWLFQKGNNANPLGAAAHDPVLKTLRAATTEQLKEIVQMVLERNVDELQRVAAEPATPILKAAAATAALRAYRTGDWSFIEGPLARVMGKVPDRLHVTGEIGLRAKYLTMNEEELKAAVEARAAKSRALLE